MLNAADAGFYDQLGDSVAISGDAVVAGTSVHQVGDNPAQGEAYVYVMPPGGWQDATQTVELAATDGSAYDNLGQSVAIEGDAIVVGAPGHANNEGALYVYVMPDDAWGSFTTGQDQTAQLSFLGNPDPALPGIGMSAAIFGETRGRQH